MSDETLNKYLHQQVFKFIEIPACACDKKGNILYMNPVAEKLTETRLKRNETLNCNKILNGLEDCKEFCPHASQVSEVVNTSEEKERRFKFSVFPQEEYNNSGVIMIIKSTDEDENKEDSLLESRGSMLENKLELQAKQIESSILSLLGEMAKGVAHELNQPLQIISLSAELCMSQIYSILDLAKNPNRPDFYMSQDVYRFCDKSLRHLSRISEQVERSSQITWHLRKFSRETGHEKHQVDLNSIIQSTLSIMRATLISECVQVHEEYSPNPLYINAEEAELEWAFRNIVLNAKESLEDKGGVISIRSYVQEEDVILDIEDTGRGIPKEIQEHIFEPFFTTKKVGEGMGLGLSVSYGIIKDHHGSIGLDTRDHTLFRVCLPHI